MSVHPFLLGALVALIGVILATLIVEHVRSESAGAAVDHGVPSDGPAPGAGAPPASPRSGAPTTCPQTATDAPSAGGAGAPIATTDPHSVAEQAGGAAAPHPPKLYAVITEQLGHGGTKTVHNWWCPRPEGRYSITDQDVLVTREAIIHDIYAVKDLS